MKLFGSFYVGLGAASGGCLGYALGLAIMLATGSLQAADDWSRTNVTNAELQSLNAYGHPGNADPDTQSGTPFDTAISGTLAATGTHYARVHGTANADYSKSGGSHNVSADYESSYHTKNNGKRGIAKMSAAVSKVDRFEAQKDGYVTGGISLSASVPGIISISNGFSIFAEIEVDGVTVCKLEISYSTSVGEWFYELEDDYHGSDSGWLSNYELSSGMGLSFGESIDDGEDVDITTTITGDTSCTVFGTPNSAAPSLDISLTADIDEEIATQ